MFYFGWMVIGFMAIAALVTFLHWWKDAWYEEHLVNIRKTSYTIMVLIYGGMILAGHILLSDWVAAVQFASIAIFIDLAIIETPGISKIGNTEFKKNEIRKTIRDNQSVITSNANKIKQFTSVVQFTDHHFSEFTEEQFDELPNWGLYSTLLQEYLHFYTDTFKLRVNTTMFTYSSDVEKRRENISNLLTPIERTNNLIIPDDIKGDMADSLATASTFVLVEDKVVLVPFYGTTNSFIITIIAGEEHRTVDNIDANNILNLVQIFDWFVDK
ncbi:type II toxin-antitoxin system SpoIISA family toxin [Paenibacillus illinoisensis]|uniref:type II toxin-antitoxin system SpoIISA family toxin n=1 Tax=Paenibacillus illinoisensis TaxID=59845 RepID=UPI00301D4443